MAQIFVQHTHHNPKSTDLTGLDFLVEYDEATAAVSIQDMRGGSFQRLKHSQGNGSPTCPSMTLLGPGKLWIEIPNLLDLPVRPYDIGYGNQGKSSGPSKATCSNRCEPLFMVALVGHAGVIHVPHGPTVLISVVPVHLHTLPDHA